MVKTKRLPRFRPAREPGVIANTMVWFSDVRTCTRCDAGSTAVMIARTVPSVSLPLMSAADWEGTRTVTGFPFQSRVRYVVLAPSTDTIVAIGALGCGGAARSAQPSEVATQRKATVTTSGREEW